jgi:hypothetical protein
MVESHEVTGSTASIDVFAVFNCAVTPIISDVGILGSKERMAGCKSVIHRSSSIWRLHIPGSWYSIGSRR